MILLQVCRTKQPKNKTYIKTNERNAMRKTSVMQLSFKFCNSGPQTSIIPLKVRLSLMKELVLLRADLGTRTQNFEL